MKARTFFEPKSHLYLYIKLYQAAKLLRVTVKLLLALRRLKRVSAEHVHALVCFGLIVFDSDRVCVLCSNTVHIK